MTPNKRKADGPPGELHSECSRSQSASHFASASEMCPKIVLSSSSPEIPIEREGCIFDDRPHGISAVGSAHTFITHYLVQQHLGGRGVSTNSEANLSRVTDAFLQALAPLGSSEKLSIVRSPEAAASSAVEIRNLQSRCDLRGLLRDKKTAGGGSACMHVVLHHQLSMDSSQNFQAASLQAFAHAAIVLVHNACNFGSKRPVHFVLVDPNTVVIVAMWLHPFYVSRIYVNNARQPHKVGREDVEGSYEVVYATNRAGLLGQTPYSTYVQTLLHILAVTLPECRSWNAATWHSRMAAAVSGQLEAAYKHMTFLGLMTHEEKESFSRAVADHDFPAACTQLCLLPVT